MVVSSPSLVEVIMRHDAQAQHPLVGAFIEERYRVCEVLYEDATTVITRAVREDLEQEVALELLKSSDARTCEAFHRSVRCTAAVRHPNVVSIFDCASTSSKSPFVVMEFAHDRRLSVVLATDYHVEYPRALNIFRQVCAALASAHDQGIAHDNLSPERIFLSQRARTTDFVSVVGFTGTIPTSPEDEAPPLQADLRALGRLGFTLFTGVEFEDAEAGTQQLSDEDHQHGWTVGALRGVPAKMRDLVERLLEGSHDKDLQTARQVVRLLEEATGTEGLERMPKAVAASRFERFEKPTGRRPPVQAQALGELRVTPPPPRAKPLGRGLIKSERGSSGVALVQKADSETIELVCYVDGPALQVGEQVAITFPRALGSGRGSFSVDLRVSELRAVGRTVVVNAMTLDGLSDDYTALISCWNSSRA